MHIAHIRPKCTLSFFIASKWRQRRMKIGLVHQWIFFFLLFSHSIVALWKFWTLYDVLFKSKIKFNEWRKRKKKKIQTSKQPIQSRNNFYSLNSEQWTLNRTHTANICYTCRKFRHMIFKGHLTLKIYPHIWQCKVEKCAKEEEGRGGAKKTLIIVLVLAFTFTFIMKCFFAKM